MRMASLNLQATNGTNGFVIVQNIAGNFVATYTASSWGRKQTQKKLNTSNTIYKLLL